MSKSLTWLVPVFFLTFLARFASAEDDGALEPFIAIDVANGTFSNAIKNELVRSNIPYEYLDSPITSEQLKGASILLISGPYRGEMGKPKEGEKNHRLYSNEEIACIENFVKMGGVMIGAGIVWTWQSYGKKDSKDFPLNQIGQVLGFSIDGCCGFDRYERKFLSFVPEPKPPSGMALSNIEFKGSYDKFIRSTKGYAGGGTKRGDGHIYIFGHLGILNNSPEFITSVFQVRPPPQQTDSELVNNSPKESEPVEEQGKAPEPQKITEEKISNIQPQELLAQEGPNLIAWITSPLNVSIPDDLRANIMLLREDLLDLHANAEKSSGMYAKGAELCYNLISSIDRKERQQIEAKLRVAQAKSRSPLSNQALEARRNYKMSWPQYEREVRQRDVLSENKSDNTEVRTRELEAKWIVTAGELRKSLDNKYAGFRASMRKN